MRAASVYMATVAINALWQVFLLTFAACCAGRLMRQAPGAWLHRMWFATTLACALLPWIAAPWPAASDSVAPVPGVRLEPVWSWLIRGQWLVAMDTRVLWTLGGLVAVAGVWRLVRIGAAYRLLRDLQRGTDAGLPLEVAELARRCQTKLGLAEADVRLSPDVSGPVTVGLRRPVVLLPEGLLERHGGEVTEAALAHEMAHVRRRDGAWKLCEELLLAPFAWHPLARWLCGRLDHARELACDEAAARALAGGRRYSRSLLAIAAEVALRTRPAAGLCAMGEVSLKQRVEQLLAGTRKPPSWKVALAGSALTTAATVAAIAAVVPGPHPDRQTPAASNRPALRVDGLGEVPWRYAVPPPPPPPPPPRGKTKTRP